MIHLFLVEKMHGGEIIRTAVKQPDATNASQATASLKQTLTYSEQSRSVRLPEVYRTMGNVCLPTLLTPGTRKPSGWANENAPGPINGVQTKMLSEGLLPSAE